MPAGLVKLTVRRVSKAKVIGPSNRNGLGNVGDLPDDAEIVLLRFLVYFPSRVKVPIRSSYMRVARLRSTPENFT